MSEPGRYNYRKVVSTILWTVLGIATVTLLGAAMSMRNHKKCKGISINITGSQDNFFIDKKEIGNILHDLCGGMITGKALGSFNLALIESTLRKNQWINTAELFFDNNEVLRVEVSERQPIARVFTSAGNSFYLDSTLTRLPLSDKTSARVPVFSNFTAAGSLSANDSITLKGVKDISSYIMKDPFWMAQIEQVDITGDRNFEMVPKVGNQIIVFGNAENYEEKFSNLMTFYKEVGSHVGWNTYSRINVQYKDQVVAVKRGTEDIAQDLLRTRQVMESIANNAQRQAIDSSKNIQLDPQPDDNRIPEARQLDDIPDEQPGSDPKPLITDTSRLAKTQPSSIERPDSLPIQKTKVVPLKSRKSLPFWLRAATVPTNKRSKSRSLSHEKPNPIPKKQILNPATGNKTTVKQLKPVTKQVTKTVAKPVTKTIIKPKEKPKTVAPPKNDY